MVEGLDEIIVRAGIEPLDPHLDRAAGGDDENGKILVLPADGAQKVKAIAIGQAQIEEHEIMLVQRQGRLGIGNAGDRIQAPPGLAHGFPQKFGKTGTVLDEEKTHGRIRLERSRPTRRGEEAHSFHVFAASPAPGRYACAGEARAELISFARGGKWFALTPTYR